MQIKIVQNYFVNYQNKYLIIIERSKLSFAPIYYVAVSTQELHPLPCALTQGKLRSSLFIILLIMQKTMQWFGFAHICFQATSLHKNSEVESVSIFF